MLPKLEDRPLRWIFLDLNSYFASVEQAEDPSLLGKPVAVAPNYDGGTIIAASYEAKKFGVKTGTRVGEAKRMCPEIVFVGGHHSLYTHYHERILEALDTVLPVDKVCSIDEVRLRLLGDEMVRENAVKLARRLKQAIRDNVAPSLSCSIGIAPNPFLAKLGTDMQKPDGLVVIEAKDLPEKLFDCDLMDFQGINRRMKARLNAAGIFSTRDLLARSEKDLVRAFGSKGGARWWYLLRGYEVDFEARSGQSLGHSNVLSPEMRSDKGCKEILMRLVGKACARLRSNGLWASHVSFYVQGKGKSWHFEQQIPPTQDAITVGEVLLYAWPARDFSAPSQVGVTFTGLKSTEHVTPSLFDDTVTRAELGKAVDIANNKFGKNSVFIASLEKAKDHAGERIAFNKTWLFSEGKGDNVHEPKDEKG